MTFRLKALALHLLASFAVLSLILGTLFAAWYRWPGWYLANVSQVSTVLTGVDLVVGPLLTFVIAAPMKPRRVLARDLAVIAIAQLCALGYGTMSLWNGRPLYYAFSNDALSVVQAYDLDPQSLEIARQRNAPLAPHWYSLPRWIWAPRQADTPTGVDVIDRPAGYQPFGAGLPALRIELKKVGDIGYFSGKEKQHLTARMKAAGIDSDQPIAIPLTGRSRPLLVVFDPSTMTIRAIFKAT